MLNSQKLKEICEVVNKESIKLLKANVRITGNVNATQEKEILKKIQEEKKRHDIRQVGLYSEAMIRLGDNNEFVKSDIVKMHMNITEKKKEDLESAFAKLDVLLILFGNMLENEFNRFYDEEMALEVEFEVDGIGKVSRDLGRYLRKMGYVEYINLEASYGIYKRRDYVTISFFENSIKFSVERILDKKQFMEDSFYELKERINSLYNQSIKKIKE